MFQYYFSEIKIQLERRQKEHKILLLGCGKAGKSTFIKQMRIIHSNQFSQKERTEYRKTIATNIATTLYTLLDHADWTSGLKSSSKNKSSKEDQLAFQVLVFVIDGYKILLYFVLYYMHFILFMLYHKISCFIFYIRPKINCIHF